jgi:hypothetical protein
MRYRKCVFLRHRVHAFVRAVRTDWNTRVFLMEAGVVADVIASTVSVYSLWQILLQVLAHGNNNLLRIA